MKEKEINTIINNNFKRFGFSHKIADPMGGTGIQNPFDGFSVMNNTCMYWETKRLVDYQAFNFRKIEEHQIKNLKLIKDISSYTMCLIILAIWKSHKYLDLFFFDISYILYNRDILGKKSILKKELLNFKVNNKYLTVKKKVFDVNKIYDKVIKL